MREEEGNEKKYGFRRGCRSYDRDSVPRYGAQSNPAVTSTSASTEAVQTSSQQDEATSAKRNAAKKKLVIYFDYAENILTDGLDVDAIASASLRGGSDGTNVENLKKMADEAATKENADEFSIQVNEIYDADFETMTDIARQDQTDSKPFTFKSELTNLDDYDTIFLGSPVWWGGLPQPVVVFLEQYDFSGKRLFRSVFITAPVLEGFWSNVVMRNRRRLFWMVLP